MLVLSRLGRLASRSLTLALTVLALDAGAAVPPPLPLVDSLKISGLDVTLKSPPAHLVVRESLGLITHESVDGQLIHRAQGKDVVLETRAVVTPGGDYLLMFPEGQHYGGSKGKKVNRLLAYRSSDRGRTWQGPTEPFQIDYSQHGFIPLIPRGSKRIYAFGTQPMAGTYDWEHGQQENAPIGFRWSDDDGRTWSDVTLIRPVNDPAFKGMSVMRMCETDSGVWLLGSHASDFSKKPLITRQYILRSEDRGKTWTVLPDKQPNGWFAAGFGRMDEGRPISLGGSKVLFMARTTQGHLFTAWSEDDGRTWTPPAPSPLIHPDAPPMLFPLSDGKTLVAFHHNRVPQKEDGNLSVKSENMTVRSEIWASTSTDGGHTWTEPRFLLANAAVPDLENGWRNYQCSYLDAFVDRGVVHLFMPHRWQQALHLTIKESALATLPTKSQLVRAQREAAPAVATKATAQPPSYAGQLAAPADVDSLASRTFDLVVVEATPGGIAMAVRAAREGLHVLLTNHTAHLGGILSSGLGVWDTQFEGKRSPIYDEVRQAIFDHYRISYGETSRQYQEALPGKSGHTNGKFEARVIEKIFRDLVAREKNITVLNGYYPTEVERDGRLVKTITFRELGGARSAHVTAKIFADCTYEGDLLPLARVAYRLGREARAEFGEPHAGVVFMHPSPSPPTPEVALVSQQHERLKLRKFSGFQEVLAASTGAADGNVQAFNYRTLLSLDPANQLPVERPSHYDPEFLKKLEWGSIVSPIPNQKLGWNRPQLVGPHTAYVEADWPGRQRIMDEFWQATLGLLYFMQHDSSVPEERRKEWQHYGLAKDEFADHEHRPYEFYVREARRLSGRYVYTEHDAALAPGAQRAPVHADSIAITEWYMDAHACTLNRASGSLDEGKMMLHQETFPGEIPYRAVLPQDVDNLLVPICLSSTHVAWGTVRLEPTWMNIAEAAAFAAVQALQQGQSPGQIDSDQLLRTLALKRVMISFFNDVDVSGPEPWIPAAEYFGAKGFFPNYDARPSAPLNQATAHVWADGLASLHRDQFDPNALARAVTQAEKSDSAPIKTTEFLSLFPKARLATTPGGITRGEALLRMWESLP